MDVVTNSTQTMPTNYIRACLHLCLGRILLCHPVMHVSDLATYMHVCVMCMPNHTACVHK